jgi:YihY family inner membrane protein
MPRLSKPRLSQAVQRTADRLERRPIWRRILLLGRGMVELHAARTASAMAFNLFLAAIPMLAVSGWLLNAVLKHSPSTLGTASSLLDLTPGYVRDIFDRHFGRFSAGAVAPVAVAGSFWLASGAFHTLMGVFEVSLGAERRSWWRKRLIALGCVLAAILALGLNGSVAIGLSGGPARIVERLLGTQTDQVEYSRYVVMAAAIGTLVALFAGFFRISVRRPGYHRQAWPGAALTVTLGGVASWALAYYAKTLARFSLFYGSLAAVAVALAWLWLWCAAILLGAELNALLENEEHERQRLLRRSRPSGGGQAPSSVQTP